MRPFCKILFFVIFLWPFAIHAQGITQDRQDVATQSMTLDTFELRDMDINDVLKLLSAKSGLNIIAGKNVQGRVTIFLQNINVHDALTIILKANDLAYIEDRGIVQIVTSAEYEQIFGHRFGVKTESKVVALQSIKAPDAVIILSQVKSPAGKVIADEQSNSIIIEDVPNKMKELLDFVTAIDVKTEDQVYKLLNVPAEAVTLKLQEMVSPKIGSAKFDLASNKIFIKDVPKKLKEFEAMIKQIDVPRDTRVFEVSYAKAEDIVKTVTPLLTKDIGGVQFDARTNSLIVTDISPKIEEISEVIRAMDKQQKQVLIEARIVSIDLSDKYKMGINWQTGINIKGTKLFDLKNDYGVANVSSTISNGTTIGTLNREQYSILLNMIATLGNTRTLSNPHLAVVNNQEAKIEVAREVPYLTSTTTTTGTGVGTTSESVTMIKIGILLTVTPTIHEDNYITMKIKPEVSSTNEKVTSETTGNSIPIKKTSQVDTVVRVKDGVTIMMGGLIEDTSQNLKTKIPILGDIPLLGKAFRSEERTKEKKEIVIFLTPHIISGDFIDHVNEESVAQNIKTNKTYFNPFPKDESIVPIP